jgi:hypothetical protein
LDINVIETLFVTAFSKYVVLKKEIKLTYYATSPMSLAPLNKFVTHSCDHAFSRQLPAPAARVRD